MCKSVISYLVSDFPTRANALSDRFNGSRTLETKVRAWARWWIVKAKSLESIGAIESSSVNPDQNLVVFDFWVTHFSQLQNLWLSWLRDHDRLHFSLASVSKTFLSKTDGLSKQKISIDQIAPDVLTVLCSVEGKNFWGWLVPLNRRDWDLTAIVCYQLRLPYRVLITSGKVTVI